MNENNQIVNSPRQYVERYTKQYKDLSEVGFVFDENKQKVVGLNANGFAEYLLNKHPMVYTKEQRFYRYTDYVWDPFGELEIEKLIRDEINKLVPNYWKQRTAKEIIQASILEAGYVS